MNVNNYPRKFTLVSTVFNEAKRLKPIIDDLKNQTLQPSEIIITDAGSNDGTYDILLDWKATSTVPILILQKNRCNVAEGRNIAINAASFEIIASTDFGCRFHPQWLESIIAPFDDPDVDVVGGAFSIEEADQETMAAKAAYVLSNGYNIDFNAVGFIPSSRSIAYKKEVFNKIGGYCEWLTLAADDLVFGKELFARQYKIHISNKPYVFWGRHKSAKGFVKEAFRYGLGDGEANVNLRSFWSNFIYMTLRYCFVVAFIFILVKGCFTSTRFSHIVITLAVLGVGFKAYIGYTKNWLNLRSKKFNFKVYLYGLVLLERTRLNYIKGYIKGYFYSSPFQKKQAAFLKKRLAQKD